MDEIASTGFEPAGDDLNIEELFTGLDIGGLYVIGEEDVTHNQKVKVALIVTNQNHRAGSFQFFYFLEFIFIEEYSVKYSLEEFV